MTNLRKLCPIINSQHTRTISSTSRANTFIEFFSFVFYYENLPVIVFRNGIHSGTYSFLNITSNENLISNRKHQNFIPLLASKYPKEYTKNSKDTCVSFLRLLFTQLFSSVQLPNDWKHGKVVPVYKSGNRNSPLNYRPISLTSVPCKIMEHIIYTHIMAFLDCNNFFHPAQHGFRRGYSCETQLATFLHDLHINLDSNQQTDAIFLDFAQARNTL